MFDCLALRCPSITKPEGNTGGWQATLQVDPAPVGNAMPYNGAGQPVGRSVDAIQSERKEEALDIVDQMLAGAQPTRMQLMTIKTEVIGTISDSSGYV